MFLCADEIAEVDGSKGDANFAMRFPDCKKQCTVTFTDVKGVTRDTITAEDSGNFVPIRGFDCRGLELAKWTPTEGLVVKSTEAPSGRTWTSARIPTDGSSIARSAARAWASPSWSSSSEPTRPSRVDDDERATGARRAVPRLDEDTLALAPRGELSFRAINLRTKYLYTTRRLSVVSTLAG